MYIRNQLATTMRLDKPTATVSPKKVTPAKSTTTCGVLYQSRMSLGNDLQAVLLTGTLPRSKTSPIPLQEPVVRHRQGTHSSISFTLAIVPKTVPTSSLRRFGTEASPPPPPIWHPRGALEMPTDFPFCLGSCFLWSQMEENIPSAKTAKTRNCGLALHSSGAFELVFT